MPCQSHQALISSNNHENSTAKKLARPYHRISHNTPNVVLGFLVFVVWSSINVFAQQTCAWVIYLVWLHSHIDRGSNISQYRIAQGQNLT